MPVVTITMGTVDDEKDYRNIGVSGQQLSEKMK